MKTLKKIPIEVAYVEFIPSELKEGILYVSLKFKVAVHNCLCGCGNKTVTPLKNNEWHLNDDNGKVSLSPSIGNYKFPCKSHYIITKGMANFV